MFDPTGHFTIAALFISIGISLVVELVEDIKGDGKIGGDKDGWDYLGAGISGFFGGLTGGKATQAIFSIAGGLADAAISGDLAENGFWSTMGSIAISTVFSLGCEAISKSISNNIQIKKLNNNPHHNKKVVKSLGIEFSFKKNGKSPNAAIKAIKKGEWVSKNLWSSFSSGLGGSVSSLLFGIVF